jgi:hypothetical protein
MVEMGSKTVSRLKEWYRGYEEYPAWLRFRSLVFAFSILAFIIVFFGPAILGGDVLGFWMYQREVQFSFLYLVVIVVTFVLAVVSGIPIFRYEFRRMKELKLKETLK